MRFCRYVVLILIAVSVLIPIVRTYGSNSTVLDAKRDAAKKIAKDGKTVDAISLWKEIIADPGHDARDYLNLARLEDKLGHNSETKAAYRKFLELSLNVEIPNQVFRVAVETEHGYGVFGNVRKGRRLTADDENERAILDFISPAQIAIMKNVLGQNAGKSLLK